MEEEGFKNLYDIAAFQAQRQGKRIALLEDNRKISFQALLEASDRLAAYLLSKGIKKGDKVALFLQNSSEYVYSVFAVSKIGAILVPVNTFLKDEELNYILENSGAKILLASSDYAPIINRSHASEQCQFILWEGKEGVDTDTHKYFANIKSSYPVEEMIQSNWEDTAVLIYTSGTTGKPKGAMLSNKNILSNVSAGIVLIMVMPKDRAIVFLPMFHVFTLTVGVLVPLSAGASIVIIRSVKPFGNIVKQVLLRRVTLFMAIPDVLNALSRAKLPWYFHAFHKVRVFVSGASTLPLRTLENMRKKFKQSAVLEGYGLSEASPAVSMNTIAFQKAGSVGKAIMCNEIKVVNDDMEELPRREIGEIIVKGDNVMQGYLGHPKESEKAIQNGWLLTGDLGYLDEDDFLFIVDRKKDLIISRGINIYPKEIESVVVDFEGIANAAVIGIANENSGEIPILYIELDEDAKIDEKALKAYMKEHLANYKIPKQIHIMDALPRNATGKIVKRVLKERLLLK